MSPDFARTGFLLLAATGLLAGTVQAEHEKAGTVVADGNAGAQAKPNILRMQLGVSGEGPTLSAALAKLKERREAITEKVKSLGAKAGSITVSDLASMEAKDILVLPAPAAPPPPTTSLPPASLPPPAPTVQPPLPSASFQPPAPPPPMPPVFASATIMVDWPLEGDSFEALLLCSQTTQRQIRDAKLDAGSAALKELRAAVFASLHDSSGSPYPLSPPASAARQPLPNVQPEFFYVARLSQECRDDLMAEAFAKAKAQAEALAKAAGAHCGPLVEVSCSISAALPGRENEAISNDPAELRFNVTVAARFRLLQQ
jgi:hypothetical protein